MTSDNPTPSIGRSMPSRAFLVVSISCLLFGFGLVALVSRDDSGPQRRNVDGIDCITYKHDITCDWSNK